MTRRRRLGPAAFEESRSIGAIGLAVLEVLQQRHPGNGDLRGAHVLVETFMKDLPVCPSAPDRVGKPVNQTGA